MNWLWHGQVDKVEGVDVVCKIKNSATLAGALFTLHASQIHIDLPTLTDKDKEVSILTRYHFVFIRLHDYITCFWELSIRKLTSWSPFMTFKLEVKIVRLVTAISIFRTLVHGEFETKLTFSLYHTLGMHRMFVR